jgi:hypothetical protein
MKVSDLREKMFKQDGFDSAGVTFFLEIFP